MNARHIVHIREALWKRPQRGACVMVGAGLSRQAGSSHPTDARPPTWGELAELLQKELRCGNPDSGADSRKESVTARDCSRLAQQYKATFGQSALDSFLLSHVPDGEPGRVHKRLLDLPWADVFTTNWDTLLEKASEETSSRTYQRVFRAADLVTTVAPRIVKLHGSFPSSRPFVVTEEDYRTYPTKFAPLVNTVQQALMESIFLLVGFSGDDPNFFHWCGWVRDHLGPAAPRLYLANFLDLDLPTRLMLEERGVVPIDLAPELAEVPSLEARYRAATEWILGSLEAGETREQRWPFPPPQRPKDIAAGIPLPVAPSDQPLEAPGAPSQSSSAEPLTDQVKKAATIWRHNRRVYPGWPILPFSKHFHLSSYTSEWVEPMLGTLPKMGSTDRLAVARELVERIERLMDPLTPELAEAVNGTLTAIEEHLDENGTLSDERRSEIDEDRTALMLALLTDSRHDLDRAKFDEWDARLDDIVQPGAPALHRLQHERCLWKLAQQDFAGLGERLNAWDTADGDPMWSLRKAALTVGSGDPETGRDLALRTLQRAEQAWAREGCVLTAARLGWALHWRRALNWAQWWDELREGTRSWQPDDDLWARLAPYDSDARYDLEAYVRQVTHDQREDSPWTFDLGRVNRFSLSNAESRSFHSARRLTRLLELSGLPSGIPGIRIVSDHIDRAARVFAPHFPAYAVRLLLVSGSGNEKVLDAVVSQTNVARMSDREASTLFETSQSARDHFLEKWAPGVTEDDFVRQRAETAVEIMSRCVVRHGVAPASEVFRWALQYRRSRRWVDNGFWSSITRLWKRSWGAMDLESRTRAVPEILQASIPDDAFITDKDPGDLLLGGLPRIERRDIDDSVWASCVHQICTALRGSDDARRLAFDRLNPIAWRRLLTETEEQEVALSLWGTVHQGPIGLPKIRNVDDWVYLVLPEPEPGMAAQRFRATWIGPNATQAGAERREETIRNVAAAWNPDHLRDRVIRLSADERGWFWGEVEEWLRHESTQRLMRGTSRDRAVRFLLGVMTHQSAPDSVLHRLADNAQPVTGRRHPIAEQWASPENEFLMVAASGALGGADRTEAEDRLRLGTRSPDGRVSLAAWNALHWWIRKAGQTGEPLMRPPSVESVGDIGVAVGTTQQSGLIGALRVARTIYEGGNPQFIAAIHSRVVEGLRRLRSELAYRTNSADPWVADELPLRRYWCVWLAWAITGAGRGDDEIVESWTKAGDEDPLCVVRFAREWYSASRASDNEEESP